MAVSIGFLFNKQHRIDGPAIEDPSGKKLWYIDGQKIVCNSQQEFESSQEYRKWKLIAFF